MTGVTAGDPVAGRRSQGEGMAMRCIDSRSRDRANKRRHGDIDDVSGASAHTRGRIIAMHA